MLPRPARLRSLSRLPALNSTRALTAVAAGTRYPYGGKPFPYTRFTVHHRLPNFIDNTSERFGDNSRVIAIEGNVAVGIYNCVFSNY